MKVKCNNCGYICNDGKVEAECKRDEFGNKIDFTDICPKCRALDSFEEYETCDKSCSPSDWHKGGKCDLNGCYYENKNQKQ